MSSPFVTHTPLEDPETQPLAVGGRVTAAGQPTRGYFCFRKMPQPPAPGTLLLREVPLPPKEAQATSGTEPDCKLQDAWRVGSVGHRSSEQITFAADGPRSQQLRPARAHPRWKTRQGFKASIFTLCICQPLWLVKEAPSSLQRQKRR